MQEQRPMKPLLWVGSSKKDLKDLPIRVQKEIGHALREIQKGKDPGNIQPLHHLHAPIREIKVEEREGTFRAVYTMEFENAIVVLHVFQKKAKKGIATPKQEINLILQRYKQESHDYLEWSTAK